MKNNFLIVSFLLLFTTSGSADTQPNVLIILADDMGYSDLGINPNEMRLLSPRACNPQ